MNRNADTLESLAVELWHWIDNVAIALRDTLNEGSIERAVVEKFIADCKASAKGLAAIAQKVSDLDEVNRLFWQGESSLAIAERLGLDHDTVCNTIDRYPELVRLTKQCGIRIETKDTDSNSEGESMGE